jgi:hypothetical protein
MTKPFKKLIDDHGISRIVSELISASYGNDLFAVPAPERLVGVRFLDAVAAMKREAEATLIAIHPQRHRWHRSPIRNKLAAGVGQAVALRLDRGEESPGSTGQGAR